jgi:hypothetical protein
LLTHRSRSGFLLRESNGFCKPASAAHVVRFREDGVGRSRR